MYVKFTPKEITCPRCGRKMGVFQGRERTVPNGIWYDTICRWCGLRRDVFKPIRNSTIR